MATAFLFASTAQADPPCCGAAARITVPGYGCGIADNAAYQFNPTGNNPNVPRGLVGSGYYGAYSPDSYSHSACLADFGAAYHDGIANYNMPTSVSTSGGYYQTGQAGESQTTYYRPVDPSSPSTNGPAEPAAPIRRGYGWW